MYVYVHMDLCDVSVHVCWHACVYICADVPVLARGCMFVGMCVCLCVRACMS